MRILRAVTRTVLFQRRAQAGSREAGQTLIEFALVLPILLVFMLLLIDFGSAMDRRVLIQHAVREGARQGAVGNDAVTHTVNQSEGILDAGDVTVCYVDGDDAGTTAGDKGDNIRVEADYTYQFNVGSGELLSAWGVPVPSINMTPHAEARLELDVPGATACP
jgi:Flp pilus assembly protein TadG